MKNLTVFLGLLLVSSLAWSETAEQLFHAHIRKHKTKKESVEFAQSQIQDRNSSMRIAAIEFIRKIKHEPSIPMLIGLLEDRDVDSFVIFALGDLQAFEAADLLVEKLNSPFDNIRGNAFTALHKIFPQDLPQGYVYSMKESNRKKEVEKLKTWLQSQKDKSYTRNLHKDTGEQDKLWERYGKDYLNRK